MTTFDEWTAAVTTAFDAPPLSTADRDVVLDLARDVAHGVARPAAPVTAYLLGIAVGRGATPQEAALTISSMAADWQARTAISEK
jgi:uncharacterized caspase-like protein